MSRWAIQRRAAAGSGSREADVVKDTSRQDTVVIYSIAGNARGCKLKRTGTAVAFLNGKITILTRP
jgi:hypothetical protein